MKLKIILSVILFTIGIATCWSQVQLGVANFRLLENDLTAQRKGTLKLDKNGKKAALIRIVTSEKGFSFDGGALGVVDVVYQTGEVWLYVPHHAQRLTIGHSSLGVLRNYAYPVPIEGGRTYEMLLDTGTGRYVTFLTEPSGATITVGDQHVGLSPVYNHYLTFGQYTVQARSGFFREEETVIVSPTDSRDPRILKMTLKDTSSEKSDSAAAGSGIQPVSMNPVETVKQRSYYIKNLKVVNFNLDLTYATPAPSLEKFAAFILFGDTANSSLRDAVKAYTSKLGEAKKTTEMKITHWCNVSMHLSDYREGYYYCYNLTSTMNKKGRQCMIIYDATTDRILSIDDVLNPMTAKFVKDKAGTMFKHIGLEGDKLIVQYQAGNDYQSIYFDLNDKKKITPYFMALVEGEKRKALPDQSSQANSTTYSDYNFEYKILVNKRLEITKAIRKRETLQIPSSVNIQGTPHAVTSIGNNALQELAIETLTIPASVANIGYKAFMNCRRLRAVHIPSATVAINPTAFKGCNSLETITVDDKNPIYCAPDNVLMTKDRKQLMHYPAQKTDTEYAIPATIEKISEGAFEHCRLKGISIPAKTTNIPTPAFSNCDNLAAISVDKDNPAYTAKDNVLMTKNEKMILRYPAGKTSTGYVVPSTVERIATDAFSSCQLDSVSILSDKTTMGLNTFRNCKNLSYVQIPSKMVASLHESAFIDCGKLEKIFLDGNLESVSAEPYKLTQKVFDVVEEMPEFPGGQPALMQWLSEYLRYPSVAEENGIHGRVICTFVVERDGSITDVQVAKSIDPSLDKEAVRLLKMMPKWNPGKQNGSPVRVKYTVPITFRLK